MSDVSPIDPAALRVRFDDLRPGSPASFGFLESDLIAEISTASLNGVDAALRAAAEAAAAGKWVAGFVAYEAAPAFDAAMRVPGPPISGLPLVWFGVFEERVLDCPWSAPGSYRLGRFRSRETPAGHARSVADIRRRIGLGEVYQVNHTLRLVADFEGDTAGLYRDLAEAQAAEYCALLRVGRFEILSASPELFFVRTGNRVTTRPMKGTAPRGRWIEEDELLRSRLLGSEKERAENIMIVDLLRNDLGRISRFGSVRVDSLLDAERYPTVWQLTSSVSAEVDEGVGIDRLLEALFPCGSVTGAPKISATRVIEDLEPEPRGVYCGAIGYLAPPGHQPSARFSVAIRTLLVDLEEGTAVYGTGGGVTYDSTPSGEYDEALLKAEILTRRQPAFELLETLRWEPGKGFLFLEAHLARLAGSAAYFGRRCDLEAVTGALDAAVAGASEPLVVRCLVDRDGSISIETAPAPPTGEPVLVAIDTVPVDTGSPFLYHKTTHRTLYERALARHPGADDVLLINGAGEVVETTRANVAARIDGEWVTPPVRAGCLPGTYRADLLEQGRLVERPIPVGLLTEAADLAVINSVRLWCPAVLSGGRVAS